MACVPGHSAGGVVPEAMKWASGAEASVHPKAISVSWYSLAASACQPIPKNPLMVLPAGRFPPGRYRGSAFGRICCVQLWVQPATWATAGVSRFAPITAPTISRTIARQPVGQILLTVIQILLRVGLIGLC